MGELREERNYKFFNIKYFAGLFFFVVLAAVFMDNFLPVFVVATLWLIDIVFSLFLRFTLRPIYRILPIGLELILFNTVVAGVALGPIAGIICGLLFSTTYYGIVFSFRSTYQIINIPMYGLIGFLAGTLAISNFFALGMLLAVAYAVSTTILISLFMGGKIHKGLVFLLTNLAFNYWLFSDVSAILLNIIT